MDIFSQNVSAMIELVSKKRCSQCALEYLRAVSRMENSADETLADDLGRAIAEIPTNINNACAHLSKSEKKVLAKSFLPLAVLNASALTKANEVKIKSGISKCFIEAKKN